jgi:hypothetical protein
MSTNSTAMARDVNSEYLHSAIGVMQVEHVRDAIAEARRIAQNEGGFATEQAYRAQLDSILTRGS